MSDSENVQINFSKVLSSLLIQNYINHLLNSPIPSVLFSVYIVCYLKILLRNI